MKNYLSERGKWLKIIEEVFENILFVKANALELFFLEKIDLVWNTELKWLWYLNLRTVYTITNSWFMFAVMYSLVFICAVYFG